MKRGTKSIQYGIQKDTKMYMWILLDHTNSKHMPVLFILYLKSI